MIIIMISTHGLDIDPRIYNESMTLIASGHQIQVICWDRENRAHDVDTAEIDGIQIKRIFVKSTYGTGFRQAFSFIRFIQEAKKYLVDKDFDVIHGHDLDGAFIGTFLRKDKKLVWDMRELFDGMNYGIIKASIYNCFAWWCFRNIDGLITVIDYQLERYAAKIKKKILCETILNTPERRIFQNFQRHESSDLRISYIGSVRHFNEMKLLMDSAQDLDQVKIKIHGSGPQLENVISIGHHYTNVEITGQFHYKNTKHLYEETDLLYVVYDKHVENQKHGIPIKGYEALYTQTPVIAGAGTYFADFVKKHDIGFVIAGDDLDELRDIILNVKNNRSLLKEKEKNIEKIQDAYVWENQAQKLSTFYSLLWNKGG